jgi:hypothetical protein
MDDSSGSTELRDSIGEHNVLLPYDITVAGVHPAKNTSGATQ